MKWVQNSFISGELAPELYGRADTEPYKSCLSYALNFIASDRGPLVRRPPTFRFGEVWDSTRTYRFVPFALSLSQQLILVFSSDDTMRIIDVAARAWVMSGMSPFSLSMGGRMNTPAKVRDFDFAQSGRILLIRRGDTPPFLLEWTNNTTWAVRDHEYRDGPWYPLNSNTASNMQGNNANIANVTVLTASIPTFDAARDVGRLVRYGRADFVEWAVYRITSVISPTQANVVFQVGSTAGGLAGNIITAAWRFGAYYTNNYPRRVAIFEDRVIEASTPDLPETVFVGTTSGFNPTSVTYSPTSLNNNSISDAEGFVRTPANDERGAGTVQWLKAGRDLFIGTSSQVLSLTARSGSGAFGPLTAQLTTIASVRVNDVTPQIDGSNLLVVEAGGRRPLRLAEAAARLDTTFIPQEVSFFSNHLFYDDTVVKTIKLVYPYPMILFIMASGRFFTVMYNPELTAEDGGQLVGIYRHELGNGDIRDCVNMFSTTSNSDESWMLVERTVNSATVYQIEYMIGQSALTNNDLVHCDHQSALTWVGTTPQAAPQFAGNTVRVVIDGADYGLTQLDSSGNFTLPIEPQTSLVVGYPYTSEAWTIPPVENIERKGMPLGQPITLKRAALQLLRSIDLEAGSVNLNDASPTVTWKAIRRSILSGGNPTERPALRSDTDYLQVSGGGGSNTAPSIAFRTITTYPLNILSASVEYDVSSNA